MGDFEAISLGIVESILKYHPCLIKFLTYRNMRRVPGEETPVIIPNTEVKLLFADGTASSRESKLLPGFLFYTLNLEFIF